jgi:carbon-monoxide dehydrogenase large subunit
MMPYQSSMGLNYDSGAFEINMHKAIEMADWFGFQERKNKSLSQGKLRGIGLANYIEAPVGAPMERVELSLNTAGEITLVTGTQSQGQGHETTFRQIIQHFTGIAFEKIFFKGGDTKFVSIGGGTHSDRSLRIVSTLINDCCNEIIQQAIKVFVAIENIEISQAYWKDRAIHVVGSEQKIELNNFMEKISKDQKLLEKLNIKSLNENNLFFAAANFKGRIPAHPTGSAVCELEIDPNTGEVDLIQYTSIDDVGQVINPMIVDGQIHGGLAQGIGQALSEGYYMDDQSGQILSGSFMDYGIPRAGVIPTLKIQLTEDPTNLNVLRIKGGGESGITPATACVYNALVNAMSSNEYEELPMPATACVIWSYLQKIKETNANKTSQFL